MYVVLLSAIVIATARFVSSTDCPNVPNVKFDPESRAAVLNKHNEMRSTLAKGTARGMGDQPVLRGKNIYEMSWDCEIEKKAQAWADRCIYEHSPDSGENIYMNYFYGERTSVITNALSATDLWWAELKQYNVSANPSNNLNEHAYPVAGHWSQIAWGDTRRIGCGVANCTTSGLNSVFVVCQYEPMGNWWNAQIYQLGDGCSKDSDCTTLEGSKCVTDTQLCRSP